MPFYDYICKNEECGHEFEESYKIVDRHVPEEEPCPSCNGDTVQMKVANPLFVYDNISGTTAKGHRKKPDEAFTDHLKQMKKNYPGSNMNV
jgi:putative FmdB family regulatory protein